MKIISFFVHNWSFKIMCPRMICEVGIVDSFYFPVPGMGHSIEASMTTRCIWAQHEFGATGITPQAPACVEWSDQHFQSTWVSSTHRQNNSRRDGLYKNNGYRGL